MNANLVEPTARENMAGTKRFWNRINPAYLTTQTTADTYVITPSVPVTGYGLNERWSTRFNIANAGTSPTVLVSSLPPLNIKKYISGALTAPVAGDIQGGVAQDWYYDGLGNAILINPTPILVQNFTSIASTSNGGLAYSSSTGAIVTRIDPSTLTTKASFTSSDSFLAQAAGSTFATAGLISALRTTLALPALKSPTVLTTSGTFVAAFTGVHKITATGGGGGGGGSANVSQGTGGGGAAATGIGWQSLTAGQSYTVTIGGPGAGGASGGADGGTGGTTTFAGTSTITATGGAGGKGTTASSASGGAGGSASNADINLAGPTGQGGGLTTISGGGSGGNGGGTVWGSGGTGNTFAVGGAGSNGLVYGAGGGGAQAGGAGAAGGNGAGGVVVVEVVS